MVDKHRWPPNLPAREPSCPTQRNRSNPNIVLTTASNGSAAAVRTRSRSKIGKEFGASIYSDALRPITWVQ